METRDVIENIGKAIETGQPQRDNKGRFLSSGNPGGKYRVNITERLHNYLAEDESRIKSIVQTLCTVATLPNARGNMPAINTILERIDGKVADKQLNININGNPEQYQALLKELSSQPNQDIELLETYPRHALDTSETH